LDQAKHRLQRGDGQQDLDQQDELGCVEAAGGQEDRGRQQQREPGAGGGQRVEAELVVRRW